MFHRSRFVGVLFALVTAINSALAATATTPISLSTTAYTDLGVGPIYLGAGGSDIIYQISDSQPALLSASLGTQHAGDPPVPLLGVGSTTHVWALATKAGASAVVATGSGITGYGGSGGGGGGAVTQSGAWTVGLNGTLPAFTATPTFNLGTLGGAATDANLALILAAVQANALVTANLGTIGNAATSAKQDTLLAAVQANAPIIASSNGSGTVTTGATAQNLFSGATPTNGYEICNPSATAELWVSDLTTAAPNGAGSYRVGPNGGCYTTPPAAKPAGAVSLYGATTAQAFTARKW